MIIFCIFISLINQFVSNHEQTKVPKVGAFFSNELIGQPPIVGTLCFMATCIYKIESPTGKIYVGQTRHVVARKSSYKTLRCFHQPKIYNSIKKYGWEKHKFSIIVRLDDSISQKELNEKEIFYITFYRDQGIELLNIREGGANGKVSEETKRKMSLALKGKKCSEETRKKIGDGNRGKKHSKEFRDNITLRNKNRSKEELLKMSLAKIGKPSWNKGIPCSETTKQKLSAIHKARKWNPDAIEKMRLANLGKKRSEETKQKISKCSKGKPNGRKGEKRSIESRNRMSIAALKWRRDKNVCSIQLKLDI